MTHEQGVIEDLCAACGRGTSHEVVGARWQEATGESLGKGIYAFVMAIRCRECGAERELAHTGGWDEVIGYLVEKRLLLWPQALRRTSPEQFLGPSAEKRSVTPDDEMLRASSAFIRNIYLQAIAQMEGGTILTTAATLAALLAAVCEDLEITGRALKDRVERLVDLERDSLTPDAAATACSLSHLAEMRVHWIVACSPRDLVDALHAIERLYLSHLSLRASHGPS
jgi:hypothetical protein